MAAQAKTRVHRDKTGARRRAQAARNQAQKPAAPAKEQVVQDLSAVGEGAQQPLVTAATPFAFNGQAIRVVVQDGQPWFVSADVCDLLEIRNSRDALARLDDDEKGVANTDTLGGEQTLNVVNESGLYHLIFKSRKPQSRVFRRWVTTEVLPSIRKTGSYKVVQAEALEWTRPHRVVLPGPGRYVITAAPGKAPYVRRTNYDVALFSEANALNAQFMALSLTTIGACLHKLQQLRATGAREAEVALWATFERAIVEGSIQGTDCLHELLVQRGELAAAGSDNT